MSNTDFHLGSTPIGPTGPLAGKGVLITRPMWQAVPLAQALGDLGAAPIIFPAIIIEANEEIDLPAAQSRLTDCTHAFFVSANAVRQGLMGLLRFPAHVRAYGPGPGTAVALHTCGATIICTPTLSYDTAGLLAMPELQSLAGERVMVFTGVVMGNPPKNDLADALRARGASVDVVACYTRRPPDTLATGVEQLCAAGKVQASILTSAEGIANLWNCLSPSGRTAMQTIPAFVPHPNVAAAARSQGITTVIDCGPGNEALLLALNHYFSGTLSS
jgi:uroporphyrinogen-III synthase